MLVGDVDEVHPQRRPMQMEAIAEAVADGDIAGCMIRYALIIHKGRILMAGVADGRHSEEMPIIVAQPGCGLESGTTHGDLPPRWQQVTA